MPILVSAQNRIGTGEVDQLYQSLCASCHGAELQGGLGSSLLEEDAYKVVGKTMSFAEYVAQGNVEMGMPPFASALSSGQMRSLEIYIDEMRQRLLEDRSAGITKHGDGTYTAGGHTFVLDTVVDSLETPWSLAFLPNGDYLITEKKGELLLVSDDTRIRIKGIPEVWVRGQGGLLEVALHPDYDANGWVYLSFSASSGELEGKVVGMTKVVRGRIDAGRWVDEETLFEMPIELQLNSGVHFGSRFVFQEGYLYFGIGDRGPMQMAQDLSKPNGKIHRIHDDGRVPEDNPFVDVPGAIPSIWTYGNRNPQGLDLNPWTGEIWESEHGPRGGDEINLIEPGINYGWPEISYGMNYNGKPITDQTAAEGMAQPKHYWTPSIAVCGIDFYEGEAFSQWTGNLLVGGLASQELHRLVIEGSEVVKDEIILKDEGRVRDVASGPDGALYLVLNGPGRVVTLRPVDLEEQ